MLRTNDFFWLLKKIVAPLSRDQHIVSVLVSVAILSSSNSIASAQSSKLEILNRNVARLVATHQYQAALPLALQSEEIAEKLFGTEDLRTSETLGNIVGIYYVTDRFREAEPVQKRLLEIKQKAYGSEDPRLLGDIDNLIKIEEALFRSSEVEPLFQRQLAILEKALGPNHPDVALALNRFALFLRGQARATESETLLKRALEIDKHALGPDHPNTAQLTENLGQLYLHAGRYRDSEQQLLRALSSRQKSSKPDSSEISQSFNDLALLYDSEGRYAESENLFKKAIDIDEKVAMGTAAVPLNSLADLFRKMGRLSEAEPLIKRALATEERIYGANSISIVAPAMNLAILYRDMGRYADAEQQIRRCIAIQEASLGSSHVDVATSMAVLGDVYRRSNRADEALSVLKMALYLRTRALGSDAPDVAESLTSLAHLYMSLSRFEEAEPLLRQALAIDQGLFSSDHPTVVRDLADLTTIYQRENRDTDALPLVRQIISSTTVEAMPDPVLPVLVEAQRHQLITFEEAFDDSLKVAQKGATGAAAGALNALAVRFSAGNDRLAQLVRREQDLANEDADIEKLIVAALGVDPLKRDPLAQGKLRQRSDSIANERKTLEQILTREFPAYQALSKPPLLSRSEIQALLDDDEVLIILRFGPRSFVWTLTKETVDWKEIAISSEQVAKTVSELRKSLKIDSDKSFDAQLSFALFQSILAPIEKTIDTKKRLSVITNGALTSLPVGVLIKRDPAGKSLKDVDWLIETHPITVLPSVASLAALRNAVSFKGSELPLIGFADPVFNYDLIRQQSARMLASITAARGGSSIADLTALRTALPQLPETAHELRQVAISVNASPSDLFFGADATETRVKRANLNVYRIVYFATHGLLAGEVEQYAKLKAEPALVLSLPDHPTETDDGLLTASEVAQLKLDAEWVVLSACNTASGQKPGAEPLSGLARAFFYAGGRSLLVSNWEVETNSAVELMTGTFAAAGTDRSLSHAEALQKSIVKMIGNSDHPEWSDPRFWAPFVVVGEPAKPRS